MIFQGRPLPGIGPSAFRPVPRNSMTGRVAPSESNPTATYYSNGATGGTVPVDATEYSTGDPVTLLTNSGSLVRAGYTFAGWQLVAG